jgi:hypothetical protein
MSDRYVWRGGSELLLRHGADTAITLLILPALFEEANRMRRATVMIMRGLAARGIGSVLPDLPGTGESETTLANSQFVDWTDAVTALSDEIRAREGRCLSVAIRGGAILDAPADHGWRLAPETGERVLRDMVRATALSSGLSATELDRQARDTPTALAGNALSPDLYTGLMCAPMHAISRRTARLTDDAGERDISLPGSRLWRAAEPGEDGVMSEAAVADIADWVRTCGG